MEALETDYSTAIFFALIGWLVRVTMYYFTYDSNTESFNFAHWWKIYDKYIIAGFVGSIALSFLGDVVWTMGAPMMGMGDIPYDERVNIPIGFLAIAILMFFDKKAKTKFHVTYKKKTPPSSPGDNGLRNQD